MTLLLDTDVLIDYLTGRVATVEYLDRRRSQRLHISTINLMEIVEGIEGSRDPARGRRSLKSTRRRVRILVVSQAVAERAARIRLDLRRRKRQTDERGLDILVAATALEHKLILVTRNRHHYDDIPDLKLADDYVP